MEIRDDVKGDVRTKRPLSLSDHLKVRTDPDRLYFMAERSQRRLDVKLHLVGIGLLPIELLRAWRRQQLFEDQKQDAELLHAGGGR